jgi:hypothetical protein
MDLASEVFFASEPSGLGENTAPCTNSIFHKLCAEGRRGSGVGVSVVDNWYPAQNDLSIALSGGGATVGAERAE